MKKRCLLLLIMCFLFIFSLLSCNNENNNESTDTHSIETDNYIPNYTSRQVNVTFIFNNGSENITETYTPHSYISPKSATKAGYTFVKWISNGTTWYFDTQTVFYKDIVLEAVYTPNQYNVSFVTDSNDNFNDKSVTYDETFKFDVPTKKGCIFKGWKNSNGVLITDEKGNGKTIWTSSKNETLFAQWEPITYTISYKSSLEADNPNPNPTKYSIETSTIVLEDISKNGYVFDGWYNENGTKVTTINPESLMHIELLAKWKLDDYTVVSAKEDLAAVAEGKYILINNIDLNGTEWIPIQNFNGEFNGNGYVISNFKITKFYKDIGLFGYMQGKSIIKNLGVESFEISISDAELDGSYCIGGLVGRVDTWMASIIDNCHAIGTIKADNESVSIKVGGLIGDAGATEIIDSYSKCSINVKSNYVTAGGLVGRASCGTITNCYSSSNIKTISNDTNTSGGLIGSMYSSTMVNCNSSSFVNTNVTLDTASKSSPMIVSSAGGLIGSASNNEKIENCYATGNAIASLTASSDIRGPFIYAYSGGLIAECSMTPLINCYATGNAELQTDTWYHDGGNACGSFIGYSFSITMTDCYATGVVKENGFVYYDKLIGKNKEN